MLIFKKNKNKPVALPLKKMLRVYRVMSNMEHVGKTLDLLRVYSMCMNMYAYRGNHSLINQFCTFILRKGYSAVESLSALVEDDPRWDTAGIENHILQP